jgi:hypothetical protein
MVPRFVRSAFLGLAGLTSVLTLAAAPARGQIPQPRVPDINQRSGLLSRSVPIEPVLPRDPDRDKFYDTRWADYPQVTHPNCYKHNGLYGLRWGGDCTQCASPYFRGSPGRSTLDADCRPNHPWSRWVQNFVHPFKPVGSYYQNGCYVPIYDLDPLVTGPGPFPWPYLLKLPSGG